jgi:large subunit ribosomal protein L29
MKLTDIREMQTVELHQKVLELKQELFTLRFQQASGQLQNGSKMRDIRKTIARMLTVIREREVE